MGRKPKVSPEIKIEYVEKIIAGKVTIRDTAWKLGLHPKSIKEWLAKYRADGSSGRLKKHANKKYCQELKIAAVHDYLDGKGSQLEPCSQYWHHQHTRSKNLDRGI